jgi:dihydrofolate reductase
MRQIQYGVAVSLDSYIAGPRGETAWIRTDPEIDFAAIWSRFDTLLMGRRTYEAALERLGADALGARRVLVASRHLEPAAHPGLHIVRDLDRAQVREWKSQPGKDIWLMGGGILFRHLLEMGEVDSINLTIVPVLLGGGVPLLPPPFGPVPLALVSESVTRSGTVSVTYRPG